MLKRHLLGNIKLKGEKMSKKRSRLFLSITALMFCLGVMCFGVYAATSVSYTLSGTITYEANGVYVDVQTQLYASTENYANAVSHRAKVMRDLDECLNYGDESAMPGADRLAKVTTYSDSKKSTTSDSTDGNVSFESASLPINFGEYQQNQKAYIYYVVIDITNYGDSDISYIVNYDDLVSYEDENYNRVYPNNTIVSVLKDLGDISAKQEDQPTKFSIIISFELYDVATSVDTTFDGLSVTLNKGKLEEQPEFIAQKSDYTFVVKEGTQEATITGYNGSDEIMVLPSAYTENAETYTVTKVDFYPDTYNLKKLYIPDTIQTFSMSLYEIYVLNSVYFPNSVQEMTDISIGESYALTSLRLSENLNTLCYFEFVSELRSLYIPASVTTLDDGESNRVFLDGGLYYIEVDEANQRYYDIDGVLYDGQTKQLMKVPENTYLTQIVIPSGVTSIGEWAFSECTSLSKITIPSTVESIGRGTFSYCTSLSEITIPSSVTSIGDHAFYECTSLSKITIPSSVTSIGDDAFSYCTSLREITIPSSVTSIGRNAFLDTPWLETLQSESNGIATASDGKTKFAIDIPTTIEEIDLTDVKVIADYAFEGCRSLSKITIPSSVESIGYYAFDGCDNLTSATFVGGGEWTVQSSSKTRQISVSESNPTQAATYLKSICNSYTWTKNV